MLNFVSHYIVEPATEAVSQYVVQPAIEAANKYIVQPAINAISKLVTANVTKSVSKKVTTKLANKMIGTEPTPEKDQMQVEDTMVARLSRAQNGLNNLMLGCAIENTTKATLTVLDAFAKPAGEKVLATVLPKAYNLAVTSQRDASYSKSILVGVTSHAAGTFMQESMDSLVPTVAPYGGYVAYGVASGLTNVALERALRL